jgi:general nucleoside transport system ATP-binding protein
MTPAVHMEGIVKRFGAVLALDGVDLSVAPGTIHAVVGENGAGKTTLMRILYGAIAPDAGRVELDGRPVRFRSSREAIEAGVGMVSQHYGIIPELSCLENLILGAEGGPIRRRRQAEARAEELAERMGFRFDWHRPAADLSPAGAQKLEILKLLWKDARIMILDEPTAMLSPADSDALFLSLRQLAESGATVLLVTHRLPEVMDSCSRVTVLRGGALVAELPVAETTPAHLATLIVGGNLVPHEAGPSRPPGDPVLEVEGLVARGARGDEALKEVGLTVRAGEIVGIAGVDGSGQRELFHALTGVLKAERGTVRMLGGEATRLATADRYARGLRVIPEDRHAEAVVEQWSLVQNAALGLQRIPPFAKGGAVDPNARRVAAAAIADRFKTRHGGLDQPMSSLSGGNQQRFVAARALAIEPRLILAFQPARGLDLHGAAQVYQGIREACEEGAGALVVSFDLDELLEHCDRVVAMNGGRLVAPAPGEERDRDAIGRLMVGAG